MLYEITYPKAAHMIALEKMEIADSRLYTQDYNGRVAETVMEFIRYEDWLEYNQESVDELLGLVFKMGNVAEFHKTLLEAAEIQLREGISKEDMEKIREYRYDFSMLDVYKTAYRELS